MIRTEAYTTRPDGVQLVRTFSDKGMIIEREGVSYCEAIDPVDTNRQYAESSVPVDQSVDYLGKAGDA